ncbi:Acg family FMN-binding oxidoreductase [Plantactinospora sp. GCM10030261]|uniref:Acg family FMN-binding oxidoreductase n=1 Tax=Plantactinospora sp. GCM10030261 TaxID=3273420 RepID=UPI00361311D8
MNVEHYTEAQLRTAVVTAIRAPSLLNSQPWRFRLHAGGIEVRVDPDRELPATDPAGWGARLACGAAVFNLRLALAAAGVPARVRVRPYPTDPRVVARLTPDQPRPPTPRERDLFAAVPRRHSNRAPFWPDPVPADARWRLVEAARAEGAWLELVIGAGPVNAVAEIARSAHRVLDRDPAYSAEQRAWIRAEQAQDGVPTAAAASSSGEIHDLLPQRNFGGRDRAPGRDFEPEPLVAVLGSVGDTAADQITAGQALQRVLLTATDAGLAASMMSQPIEVPGAREQLRLALGRFGVPQMVLRVGYGQPGWPTPRRDPATVIDPPTDGQRVEAIHGKRVSS